MSCENLHPKKAPHNIKLMCFLLHCQCIHLFLELNELTFCVNKKENLFIHCLNSLQIFRAANCFPFKSDHFHRLQRRAAALLCSSLCCLTRSMSYNFTTVIMLSPVCSALPPHSTKQHIEFITCSIEQNNTKQFCAVLGKINTPPVETGGADKTTSLSDF